VRGLIRKIVWALALKIQIIYFSGARVVIAHKEELKERQDKNVY